MVLALTSMVPAQTGVGVNLDVECDDVALRSLVRGYFSAKLRELDGVRVGEGGRPDYQFQAVAHRVGKRGWMMSVVVNSPFHASDASGVDAEVLSGYTRQIEHQISRGDSSDDLDREIARLVKEFDREVLNPRRKEAEKQP